MVYLFMITSLFAPIIYFVLKSKLLFSFSLVAIAVNVFPILYSGIEIEMSSPIIAAFLLLTQTLNLVAGIYAIVRIAKGDTNTEAKVELAELKKMPNVVDMTPANENEEGQTSKVTTLTLYEGNPNKRA